ncbi:hypothetical protein ACL02U_10580 [Streptomyces sp. MS06]
MTAPGGFLEGDATDRARGGHSARTPPSRPYFRTAAVAASS